jgi:hypothetical protein
MLTDFVHSVSDACTHRRSGAQVVTDKEVWHHAPDEWPAGELLVTRSATRVVYGTSARLYRLYRFAAGRDDLATTDEEPAVESEARRGTCAVAVPDAFAVRSAAQGVAGPDSVALCVCCASQCAALLHVATSAVAASCSSLALLQEQVLCSPD